MSPHKKENLSDVGHVCLSSLRCWEVGVIANPLSSRPLLINAHEIDWRHKICKHAVVPQQNNCFSCSSWNSAHRQRPLMSEQKIISWAVSWLVAFDQATGTELKVWLDLVVRQYLCYTLFFWQSTTRPGPPPKKKIKKIKSPLHLFFGTRPDLASLQ